MMHFPLLTWHTIQHLKKFPPPPPPETNLKNYRICRASSRAYTADFTSDGTVASTSRESPHNVDNNSKSDITSSISLEEIPQSSSAAEVPTENSSSGSGKTVYVFHIYCISSNRIPGGSIFSFGPTSGYYLCVRGFY